MGIFDRLEKIAFILFNNKFYAIIIIHIYVNFSNRPTCFWAELRVSLTWKITQIPSMNLKKKIAASKWKKN